MMVRLFDFEIPKICQTFVFGAEILQRNDVALVSRNIKDTEKARLSISPHGATGVFSNVNESSLMASST